jgi:murein DD-endopeptidase MepM/ murein hydrolase activator NlpD
MTFVLERSEWESYRVVRTPDTLFGIKDSIALEYSVKAAQGTVESTLWQTMKKAEIPDRLIFAFTDLLSYDFDFVTDTRNGQSFRVLYEEYSFKGRHVRFGKILLAQYNELSGKTHTACYFKDPSGKEGYYNADGKNTKRSLLKTPLSFARISSHFTHSRYHPILKKYRPHLGVDFAVPTGTPIIASGSGKVIFAGFKGGYGNYIEIRHDQGIETCYGHLSRFANGIREGVHVSEGAVIGYVGSTGLATGPHLDYRVRVKGTYVNPLKYAAPSGPPIDGKYLASYKKYSDDLVGTLGLLCQAFPSIGIEKEALTEAKVN